MNRKRADMQRVAVIGAGLAGVVLARHLAGRAEVELFEKSRGVSGRLSTRRVEGGFQFDHGAQYFTARDPRFQLFLEPYLKSGLVQEWKPRLLTLAPGRRPYKRDWFEPHYVAAPGMSSLVKELARGLRVSLQSQILEVLFEENRWYLKTSSAAMAGPFDWVVSTCPAEQTRALLPGRLAPIGEAKLQGCFALLLGFESVSPTPWQAAVFRESCLGWACWNQSKPGRAEKPALVVLSRNDWAELNLESSLDEVQARMQAELQQLAGIDAGQAVVTQLHRWRFANASQTTGESFLIDSTMRLAACGDWCMANRAEAAFLSAARLANRLHQLIPHP